jgi:hypothetical protein
MTNGSGPHKKTPKKKASAKKRKPKVEVKAWVARAVRS